MCTFGQVIPHLGMHLLIRQMFIDLPSARRERCSPRPQGTLSRGRANVTCVMQGQCEKSCQGEVLAFLPWPLSTSPVLSCSMTLGRSFHLSEPQMKRAILHRSVRSCCVRSSWLAGQAPHSLGEASLLLPDRTLFFSKAPVRWR